MSLTAPLQGEDESENIFELSPFRVETSSDEGYRATNATSGTRLNTEIKDLPMSIEVVTTEFIEDIGATDLKESLDYSSGISSELYFQAGGGAGPGANQTGLAETSPSASGSVGDVTNNALTIRGFNAPFQQRMGFRVGTTVPNYGVTLGALIDSVNVERHEILRGPGALLYGIGVISGIVNVQPKLPSAKQRTIISAGAGNNGYLRGTFDITGPLGSETVKGDLNYRFATAYTEDGDWTDFFSEEREYYVGQLEYRPIRNLTLLMEYQSGTTRFEGLEQQYLYDNLGGANNQFYRNEFYEQFDWGKTYGNLPPSYRATGPDTWYERKENTYLFNVEFTPVKNLTFNVGYFNSEQDADRFTVNLSQFNNTDGPINVSRDLDPNAYYYLDNNPDQSTPDFLRDDFKAIRYWWVLRPQSADSEQVRAEANYLLETGWFNGSQAMHNFLVGYQSIEDEVEFFRGTEFPGDVWNETLADASIPINEDGDAYFVRDFFDFSPLRYNREPLAQPGRDYYTSNLWYSAYYGVYHGKFWNDRLSLIAGVREDRYQAYEEEWRREKFDPTNKRTGTERARYNFEDPVKISTGTIAVNFALTDAVSIYALKAQGVAPNTGQLDGADNFIPPEETESEEIGLKFDLLDGKLSGTISAYRITRENATWFWENAPDPKSWVGGPFDEAGQKFDPARYESGEIRRSYGVDLSYFDPATELNWPLNADGTLRRVPPRQSDLPPGVVAIQTRFTPGGFGSDGIEQTIVYLDYDMLDEAGFRDNIENAFAEARTRSQPDDIDPITYRNFPTLGNGFNASNWPGSTVTFTDEATGVDLQLIYAPLDNWQIVVSYAHTEREAVSGFHLVDARDVNEGILYGTEYDIWVRDLGRENFVDPTMASTATGGGVEGLSLYFGPEDTGSVWSNYKFVEGSLDGFEFGLGFIYQGPARTSVPIGGVDLATNRYPTPTTKEYYRFDTALTYKRSFERFDFRISLNIYNVLGEHYLENSITYENVVSGDPERRRSFRYVEPRYYRITMTLAF